MALERSLSFRPQHALHLAGAAFVGIYLNQLGFIYAIDLTNASTTALIFGSLPIVTAIFADAMGVERLSRRFWIAAAISFAGVALVALGSHGEVSGNLLGDLLAFLGAATWGFYSVAIVPLVRRYSAWRVSAGALVFGSVPLLVTAAPQLLEQRPLPGHARHESPALSSCGLRRPLARRGSHRDPGRGRHRDRRRARTGPSAFDARTDLE